MLIIFDLDDTLIDTSGSLIPICLKKALKEMIRNGLTVLDEEKAFSELIEINNNSYCSEDALKKFLEINNFDKYFLEIAKNDLQKPLDNFKIFPLKNSLDTLEFLSKSYTLALVSKGNRSFQLKKIEIAGIDTSLFSKIIITKINNKGYYYKKLINYFKTSPQNTLVCGDKIKYDLLPAKNIGCKTVHMKWGRDKNIFESKIVDYHINDILEIKKIIRK